MLMKDLISRVRSYTRDTTGTLFTLSDVKSFINEGVDKFKQIKELNAMTYLDGDSDEPKLLPSQYHYSLAVYSASRCFSQDEQHFPAQSYMDEFNGLFALIELGIKNGDVVITDSDGSVIESESKEDGVKNVYFDNEY